MEPPVSNNVLIPSGTTGLPKAAYNDHSRFLDIIDHPHCYVFLVIPDSTWGATWQPLVVESPLRTESTQRCPCELYFDRHIDHQYHQRVKPSKWNIPNHAHSSRTLIVITKVMKRTTPDRCNPPGTTPLLCGLGWVPPSVLAALSYSG